MTDQKLNDKESPVNKCAIFTLAIQNDDFDCMDLMAYSRIMEGMTKVIGPKARIVSHSMNAMVFEENAPRSWRDLPAIDLSHDDSTEPFEDPLEDELEYMDDSEIVSEIAHHLGNVNMDTAWFDDWSRESLLTFRRLILIEKAKTK